MSARRGKKDPHPPVLAAFLAFLHLFSKKMFYLGIPYTNYTKAAKNICLNLQKNTFVCFSIDIPQTNNYN